MSIAPGTKLGRYEVRSKIGEGGMGEVYLAEDSRLHRKVALKVLPADLAANKDRMRRFEQEAQAAAALNHPNIAHIYEIGESDGTSFIAMEYVDGFTLRQMIHEQQTELPKLLRYLQHVAEGLAKAHAAGIVHRDLKPDNIMATRDGHAKVLDFGLAKLVEPQRTPGSESSEIATAILQHHSTPGAVLGTLGYMSPEQAQGRVHEIDHRSDIFSFGCILYEAITRHKAFAGKDLIESLNKIIREPPPAISDFTSDTPYDLQRIVRRCLAKDPDERYQTIKDVAIELKELRRELQARAGIHGTVPPSAGVTSTTQTITDTDPGPTSLSTVRSTQPSSAEYIVSGIKQHRLAVAIIGGIVLLAIAAIGIRLYIRHDKGAPFQSIKITRLTTTGKASNAAISPDGKYIVHVQNDGGQESLWIRQVATQSNVQIVAPAAVIYNGLSFSPDGNYIYYSLSSQDFSQRTLFQLPVLGGAPKKVLDDLDTDPVSFSPDGKQFAFIRFDRGKECALMIANSDGSGERKLVSYKNPPDSIGYPTWATDGKRIAYVVLNGDSNDETVFTAHVTDGSRQPLTSQRWFRISALAWLSDGSGLLMLATPEQQFIHQIWQLSYPDGEARRLINDLNDYVGMSLTADSGTLAVVKTETQSNIWVAPTSDASHARPVTSGAGNIGFEVSFSPDGEEIVYSSSASGNEDIWIVHADGSNTKQLTANSRVNGYPAVSPDGRYVIFMSDRTGVPHLWQMNIDGSDQRQLTDGSGEQSPQFSPDGRWIVYRQAFGKATVWKMPADGGEPVQLNDKYSTHPTVSPDSKMIAYRYRDADAPWRLAVAPLEGGEPLKTFDLPPNFRVPFRWTADGRALAYIETKKGVSNIVAQPLNGGTPRQLTDFQADRIFWFDFSRDGRQLALSRGTLTSDVILIKDAR